MHFGLVVLILLRYAGGLLHTKKTDTMTRIAEENAFVDSTSSNDSGPTYAGTKSACRICEIGWCLCPLVGAGLGFVLGYVSESNQAIFGLADSHGVIVTTTILGALLGHIVCRRLR